MATTSELTLYSTSSCHLCELAAGLIAPWLQRGWRCEEVDIANDDALFERYGLTIPVLKIEASGRELNWPFDADSLAAFLTAG